MRLPQKPRGLSLGIMGQWVLGLELGLGVGEVARPQLLTISLAPSLGPG